MFTSDFRSTIRNLSKNKTYSFLNIFGLAIGILCASLIFLWVEDEVTFNHNFAKRDYIYHVMQNEKHDGNISTNGSTPGPLAMALKTDIPGIKSAGRLSWNMDELVIVGDKSIKENGLYADASVLSMLSLPFIRGNAQSVFKELQSVVISETFAKKFFGDDNPVGKTIKMNANQGYSVDGLYTITGVFRDLPKNASFQFQWISPYEVWENYNTWLKPWNNNLTQTVVELEPSADLASIEKSLKNYLSTKITGAKSECFLFSMNDWNLKNHFENGVQEGGKIKYVNLFSLIASVILLIACINFMNLSTARSGHRSKEVGVLKVMGADRARLIRKFLSESLILSFLAVLLAIVMLFFLLPLYNGLVKKDLVIDLFKPMHLNFLFTIAIIAGLTAGSYPAFYLSSFNPIKVLKGLKIKSSLGAILVRKGLVITQFSVSIILIISTIIIYQQIQHIKNRNLGYNKNNLITMELQGNVKERFNIVKSKLLATGNVENMALSLHSSLQVHSYGDGFRWQGLDPSSQTAIHSNGVSPEYLSTMHMQLLSGRNFYSVPNVDSNNVIINESMAKLMGKEGKTGSFIIAGRSNLEIVGIMKDFVYNDLYGKVEPLILFCNPSSATLLTIRFKAGVDLGKALAKTESVMNSDNPGYPFEYKFLDEEFNRYFETETLISKLAGIFAVLAIFISCLGLFGLAAYTAERRTKEIGIRKILGASVQALGSLLSKEFLQLVVLSCVIAFPFAWWAMHAWLQDYKYRTDIQWWVFVVAGLMAIAIALITVSFQAIKAALANPVKSLRAE